MSKKAILCIDDEKIILDSLRSQFKRLFGKKYTYDFAENGEDGLEILEEYAEDEIDILIIFSDYLMPGMKGDDFLIRAHEKFPKIRKILLTGQADASAIKRAKEEANLHACLQKPWSEEDLVNVINDTFESNLGDYD